MELDGPGLRRPVQSRSQVAWESSGVAGSWGATEGADAKVKVSDVLWKEDRHTYINFHYNSATRWVWKGGRGNE